MSGTDDTDDPQRILMKIKAHLLRWLEIQGLPSSICIWSFAPIFQMRMLFELQRYTISHLRERFCLEMTRQQPCLMEKRIKNSWRSIDKRISQAKQMPDYIL